MVCAGDGTDATPGELRCIIDCMDEIAISSGVVTEDDLGACTADCSVGDVVGVPGDNTNALFYSQDALGPMLRGIVMFGCGTAGLAEGVAAPRPFLRTLQQMTNVPKSSDPRVCPPLTGFPAP